MSLKPMPTNPDKNKIRLFFVIISLLTIVAFSPVFNAGFVNWDDNLYVTENQQLQQDGSLKALLTEPVAGNYHPVTMLSLAVDYKLSGGKASWFHSVNLFLHLINIFLVFFFIYFLTDKKLWIAIVTASLFALHPLHVESVAWISERKDVLYSVFFLGGLILYLKYLKNKDWKLFSLIILFSILSMLSKPAAVVFPLVLVAVDFYLGRLKQKQAWIEKIPFFVISIIMGIVTLLVQKDAGAYSDTAIFSFPQRFMFANYGLMMYLVKTILPINLCAFYPFPAVNEGLPFQYYISLLVTAALIVLFVFSLKKGYKFIAFAIVFYVINLLLVLQLLPIGSAVIADRYSYIPLIATFFIIGFFVQKAIDKKNGKVPNAISIPAILILVVLAFVSRSQAATWKDGASLWDKAISACPSGKAFSNRGIIYKSEGKTQEAFDMFSKAIDLDKNNTDAFINRANILFGRKQYSQAIDDYSQCLIAEPDNDKAYANRGAAYLALGKYSEAMIDLTKTIELNSSTQNGYKNRGMLNVMTGNYKQAIADYIKHLEIVPDTNGEIYYKIGYCFQQINDDKRAVDALSRAIKISPNPEFFHLRAVSLTKLGDVENAQKDFAK